MHQVFQPRNDRRVHATPAALVGIGSVGEPVAQYPAPCGQCRPNYLGQVFGACGKHQLQLAQRVHAGIGRIEQQATDHFGKRRTARFARDQHVLAGGQQLAMDVIHIGALAYALDSLDGDESSVHWPFPSPGRAIPFLPR